MKAFNGDTYLAQTIIGLVRDYKVQAIIETGTNEGHTTEFFSTLCPTFSIEIYSDKVDRARVLVPAVFLNGDSSVMMPGILADKIYRSHQPFLFYLDAHNPPHSALKGELNAIANAGLDRPVIVIHDFQVPHTDLGYDVYADGPLNWDYIKDLIPRIYPDGFKLTMNSIAEGARRGVAIITPI